MCGLGGVFLYAPDARVDEGVISAITDRMSHRGPDGRGAWVSGSIGLGHRRLAVIDPIGGAQPMANERGRVRVVFNGEIYNHHELRLELEGRGHRFRTRCDTEVLVHLYEDCGADFVRRLNGMFAVAVWDARAETLTLARDRLGIKPLFYYAGRRGVVFASELSALLEHPDVPREVEPTALHLYLNHEFVPAPRTMLAGVRKLRAAERLVIDRRGEIASDIYWHCPFEPKAALSDEEATEAFAERCQRAVRRQLMSDVPLGAFLSGGIDSSSVVFWMREHAARRPQTFSIGFDDPAYDERPYARQVAAWLDTDHHEEVLSLDAMAVVDVVTAHLDEPLGDLSAVPTYLVSRLARQNVTVCLSGDGCDELLAGYERHLASRLSRLVYERIPECARRKVIDHIVARLAPTQGKKGLAELMRRFVEGAAKDRRGEQMRWQTFLPASWLDRLYTPAMRQGTLRADPFEAVVERVAAVSASAHLDRELAIELGLYLPDDILTKLDRLTMAVSLEARVPFLDHELVEFTAALPARLKMRWGRGKYILRRAMRGKLPARIVWRRKEGFSFPVKRWLRGAGGSVVAEAFRSDAIRRSPWLEPRGLDDMLAAHRAGTGDYTHQLWPLFVLALWLSRLPAPAAAGAPAASSRGTL